MLINCATVEFLHNYTPFRMVCIHSVMFIVLSNLFYLYQMYLHYRASLRQSVLMHFLFSSTIMDFKALAITNLSSWNLAMVSLYVLVWPSVSLKIRMMYVFCWIASLPFCGLVFSERVLFWLKYRFFFHFNLKKKEQITGVNKLN